MGFFTWTFANKPLIELRCGDYSQKCKLPYDGYGAILCPDNTLIKEPCYQGYGIFAGIDIYDLVLDWNRDHLTDILKNPNYKQSRLFGSEVFDIAAAFQSQDNEKLQTIIEKLAGKAPYLRTELKRSMGIEIACGANNHIIPFPIKIVSWKRPVSDYKHLPASESTQ